MKFSTHLKNSILFVLVTLVICGFIYPLVTDGLGHMFMSDKANGSMIEVDGKEVGSKLLGQQLTGDQYFQGRVSGVNYNSFTEDQVKDGTAAKGIASGGSNLSATNKDLKKRVEKDTQAYRDKYKRLTGRDYKGEIPGDLVTASGSGLDPNISLEAAKFQIPMVAAGSKLSEKQIQEIVDKHTQKKVRGIFGQERVNVLECNIDIYKLMNK